MYSDVNALFVAPNSYKCIGALYYHQIMTSNDKAA